MWLTIVFTIVLFICFSVLLYNTLFYSLNFDQIKADDSALEKQLSKSDAFANLLNTNGINNIPGINLITTNLNVAKAANCATSPINIGSSGSAADCIRLCGNSDTKLIHVTDLDEIYYNANRLQTGNNCVLGNRPACNTHTTVALMTINSIVCKPKFPNIVAGPLGTTIIACNNRMINDPENVLWDYKFNVKFDPLTTTIQSEDELLQDNNYRFRCKFNGRDDRHNTYQQHPYNRFHPVRNYCANLIYGAHPSVKTIYDSTKNALVCECGDKTQTRVQNLIPDDKSSQCSDKIYTTRQIVKRKQEMTIVNRCFTLFSPLDDVGQYLPCTDTQQFTKQGSQTQSIKVEFTIADDNAEYAIEHPQYGKMPDNGQVWIHRNMEVA